MRASIDALLAQYQIRKSNKEKQAFTAWLKAQLQAHGYELTEERYSKNGCNLVVGDVKTAKIILTAHYDTQPNFFIPVMMGFSNWFFFLLSQIILMLPLIALLGLFFVARALFPSNFVLPLVLLAICLLYGVQITCGIANKHTANDNTSGVAALIAILEDLPKEDREKVCVVFFDQEELNLVGSNQFKKKYKADVISKPLINFDCVSDGQTLMFVMKKKFKKSNYFGLLKAAGDKAVQGTKKQVRYADALTNIYTSDQMLFKQGVGVVAAKKSPLGYYIDRIHSGLDTNFDNENIELLKDIMLTMLHKA